MSLVEFFFNGDYREDLMDRGRPAKKFSFHDELVRGDVVKIGVYTVAVLAVDNDDFKGVIFDQDNLDVSRDYRHVEKRFTHYDRKLTVEAYKLFRQLKSGEITSLFINKKEKLPLNVWLHADSYPTKGFAVRPGWHCTAQPVAPHLKMKLSSGEQRVWKKILMLDYTEELRPENQGGLWYLAKKIKIL